MITGKDVAKDIKMLELKMEKGKVENADVLKAITLLLKVAVSIRTNQVLGLKKAGVVLIKPRTSEGRGKPDEKK